MRFLFPLIVLLSTLAFALRGDAEVFALPDWFPSDMRFNVACRSNEVEEIDETLKLMWSALHPKMQAEIERTKCLPQVMQWVVHVSQPGATNEAAYFDTFKPISVDGAKGFPRPADGLVFDRSLLTNRMARLSYIPPFVMASISYDDGHPYSRARPVPVVDYPGVAYEDEGTTANTICLTLRAPKAKRLFKIHAIVGPHRYHNISFKVVSLAPGFIITPPNPYPKSPQGAIFYIHSDFRSLKRAGTGYAAIFAREERGPWGPPVIIRMAADELCEHHYDKDGNIEYIDYGGYCDWYKLAGPNQILGFTRKLPGMIRGEAYSNTGELILETYAEDQPKETQRVDYLVQNGKLQYTLRKDVNRCPNQAVVFRSEKW